MSSLAGCCLLPKSAVRVKPAIGLAIPMCAPLWSERLVTALARNRSAGSAPPAEPIITSKPAHRMVGSPMGWSTIGTAFVFVLALVSYRAARNAFPATHHLLVYPLGELRGRHPAGDQIPLIHRALFRFQIAALHFESFGAPATINGRGGAITQVQPGSNPGSSFRMRGRPPLAPLRRAAAALACVRAWPINRAASLRVLSIAIIQRCVTGDIGAANVGLCPDWLQILRTSRKSVLHFAITYAKGGAARRTMAEIKNAPPMGSRCHL